MRQLASDVAVAAELIKRADLAEWTSLGEGLLNPTPRIDSRDSEKLRVS